MVRGFLRRGHSLDRFLRRRRVMSCSPSFSSSPSPSLRSSSGRRSMEEEEEAAAAPLPPLQKRVLSRSHGSKATPGRLLDLPPVPSKIVRDGGPPSDMELMMEKFAKLLLGEDMSGTGKGVSSALALSNAITNLAASVFGEQRRLEPMSSDRRARWNKETGWLLSVTDHIVEFVPSQQASEDGTNMEVMGTKQRRDLLMNIPALRKLDAMLLEYLDNFKGDQEFWYVSKDADESEMGDAPRQGDKWWIPTVRVPPEGLSDMSKKWLQHQKDLVGQVLKAAMTINADVLTEMEIPEEYIESLPKNGRSSLGESIYKRITDDNFNPNELLNSVDLSTEHKIVDLKDRIEASVVIWQRKICNKLSWGPGVSLEKREQFEGRAQTVLLILKHRFPGIPQSSLDISKIQYNRDVGLAILESYSRAVESLAYAVLSRIEDVLYADAIARDPKRTKSRRPSLEDIPEPPVAADGSLLYAHPDSRIEELGILNTIGWPHVVFDVSSQETSFHIPLHRMLSSLLRKAMKKCFGEDTKPEQCSVVQSSEFFSQVLRGCEPYGFASIVMEHPLRVRVFCAQVRAGMWRKNGDAAILSVEWYRSVQWLEQGLESDLFLLQCCAALSSPEFFVRTIQERFGLSNYTSLVLAEQNEYESVLMQEMLTFLIQLVKERRFCGLSTADNLKRELIYKLAVGDATHSQIVKSLPRDLSSSDQLQNVLDSLAVFSNPSGMKQGKYGLCKAFWKELDLYHPRWNSRELQIAEERYYRFCKISALNAQLPQWTHVFSPLCNISKIATSKAVLRIVRAVLFYAVYSDASLISRAPDNVLVTGLHLLWLALDICESESQMYANQYGMDIVQHDDESWVVLSSYTEEAFPVLTYSTELVAPESEKVKNESMLTLLVSLMHKYKEQNDITFSGSKYCNIPSLIESLLKRFAKLSKECMSALRQMTPHIVPSIPDHTNAKQSLGSSSDSMEKKAKARQRQAAIMVKMRAEQLKFDESMKSSGNEGCDVPMSEPDVSSSTGVASEESLPVCSLCRDSDSKSPLCYLILLQKSRFASFVEMGNPSWENPQSNKTSGSISREESTDSSGAGSCSSEELVRNTTVEPSFDLDTMEVDALLDFSNEQHPLIRYIASFPSGHSISNADDTISLETIEADIYESIVNDLFGSSNVHIQDGEQTLSASNLTVGSKKNRIPKCSVLGTYVTCLSTKHRQSLYDVASKSSASVATRNRFGPVDCDGIHISSCGHAVHQECHDRYLFSLKQRYIRRLGFEGGHIVDPDLGELLCPVCRRFANSILPVSPDFSSKTSRKVMPFVQTMPSEAATTTSDVTISNLQFPRALSLLESAGKIVGQSKFLKALSGKVNDSTEPALDPSLRRLAMLYYPRSHSSFSASERLNPSLFLWDTLRYSVVSTEIASRGRITSYSFESKSCLESLRSELNSSSGFILCLLFRVAHSARNLNCLEVLLRFEGIQLLAGSICSGISGDKDLLNATKRKGTLPPMVDPASEGEVFPDIQFWKQCADPVLAQDPFSSLMSALFCLPVQFLTATEFFVPFVHLFYIVCVIQALITCYGEETFDRSSCHDCLLNDVCHTMSGYDIGREYFVSKYINPSCHPKDMVRRLTYPYLRRCALLLELLRSSSSAPLYDSSNIWEGSHLYLNNTTTEGGSSLVMEMYGIRELEHLFQIQSLDLILQDESVHMLALKWSQHFCEDYRSRKYRGILFSTPAVPFRLMQLPPVYQVLLERYVKMQCPDCGSVPDEPALCLLCGKLCSPSWKPCCRTGKCLNHASQCGAGVGIFLLVRKTTILLQRSARLAFWPSPYLDAFGEEDHEMQRGKPLYLNQERYAALTYLVASHSLDRTSEVLRQTTISFYASD